MEDPQYNTRRKTTWRRHPGGILWRNQQAFPATGIFFWPQIRDVTVHRIWVKNTRT